MIATVITKTLTNWKILDFENATQFLTIFHLILDILQIGLIGTAGWLL